MTAVTCTYMQARFYDPQVGRFLSTDPVNFDGKNPFTFNRYSYGNNNPYRYVDPTGRSAETPDEDDRKPPPEPEPEPSPAPDETQTQDDPDSDEYQAKDELTPLIDNMSQDGQTPYVNYRDWPKDKDPSEVGSGVQVIIGVIDEHGNVVGHQIFDPGTGEAVDTKIDPEGTSFHEWQDQVVTKPR